MKQLFEKLTLLLLSYAYKTVFRVLAENLKSRQILCEFSQNIDKFAKLINKLYNVSLIIYTAT